MKTNDSGQGNRKRVGAEIRKVREAKGMTRKELAAILGGDCTENTVKRYEDGDIIMDVDVLFAVTAALGVTPNDIAPGEVMASAASGLGSDDRHFSEGPACGRYRIKLCPASKWHDKNR